MVSKRFHGMSLPYFHAYYHLKQKLKRVMDILEGFNQTPVSILKLQGNEDLKWLELNHPLLILDNPKHFLSGNKQGIS